jgi:histidinol-phosphatase (PHP family)
MADGPYAHARLESWVAGKTIGEATAPYFAEVAAAVRSGLFDTLGHLDMCKRWLVHWFPPAAFAAAPELYEPILRLLVDSEMALEVNSSGLRQGPHETYPAGWVVARFRELGGQRVTVGSDAHLPQSFAFGLEEAYEIVAAAGFSGLTLERALERGDLVLPKRFQKSRKARH